MKRLSLVLALYVVGACSKSPSDGQLRLAGARSALGSAGAKVDDLKSTDPSKLSAQKCEGGTLDGLDAVLCEYGSAEAVALGKKAATDWIGQATTGAALQNGLTVFAVADRNRTDPNGKTIHKLTSAYQKAH